MRMKIILFLLFFVFGCARVRIETTKPIKVDINMRVDIYQHVAKDAESINDQIYGSSEKDFNALFNFFNVYAADLSVQASAAIQRRKDRVMAIEEYFAKGYIGENRGAFLQLRDSVPGDKRLEVEEAIRTENEDRSIIYNSTAEKNNTNALGVAKVFFENDYKRSSSGYWFEVYVNGSYVWVQK